MLINLLHIKKNDHLIFLFVLLFSSAAPTLVCVTAFERVQYMQMALSIYVASLPHSWW